MRDLKIIVPADRAKAGWNMDIDIINGYPAYVQYERNTQDQRAALSAYTVKGTIPGKENVGVDWAMLYEQNTSILDVDNAIKQNIQNNAGTPGLASQAYIPIYTKDEEGIHAVIYQSS